MGDGLGRHRVEKGLAQTLGLDPGQQVGCQVQEPLLQPGPPGVGQLGPARLTEKGLGRVLERLALQQPSQEQVALLPQGQLLLQIAVVPPGEQAAGLELDQGGGDEEELGGHVQIDGGHLGQLGQIGVHDAADRDLVEVHLLLGDEVQEEVEGALEDRRRDVVGHQARIPGGPFRAAHTMVR